ncbi:hypothetical protein D3C75_1313900 [compost metagenome]
MQHTVIVEARRTFAEAETSHGINNSPECLLSSLDIDIFVEDEQFWEIKRTGSE